MLSINLFGQEYALSNKLRVAYRVQGQHDHKPYTEVFSGVGDMPIEDQIGIIYESFWCANPEARDKISRQQFLDFVEENLDKYDVKSLMEQLREIIQGIMGVKDDDLAVAASEANPQ